jgi:uncharacterized protein Yka (UPF0111/DUF47 family)
MVINTIEKYLNQIEPKVNFMARQGICKNYSNCYLADRKELQSFDTSNGICQNEECGSKLTEITPIFPWKQIGILILLILILSGILWYFIPLNNESDDITKPEPPQAVIAPIEQFRTKITEIQGQIDASKREIGKMSSIELINKLKNIQNSIEQLSKSIEQLPITQESKTLQTQLKKLQTQIKLIYSQAEIQGQIETIDTKIEAIKTKIDKISWVELINKLKNVQNSIEQVSKSIEQLPITQESKTLQTQFKKSQTKIKLIYTQLINNINPKINTIKNQIGTSSIRSLSIDLKSVQTQIKAIQNIIKQGAYKVHYQQIETQQTQIEQIYAQLLEIIKKQLENISVQTDTTTLIVMASKLDEIQKQIWAIHKPIKLFYDTNSSPYKWVNKLQTQIETFYDQLVDKIQQQIEIIKKLPLHDSNDGVSLTIKLEDIQTQIDNVQKLLDKLADIPKVTKLQKQIEKQQIWIGMTYRKLIDYIQTEIYQDIPACADKNSQRSKLEAFQTLIVEIQKRIGKSIKTPNMATLKTRLELQQRKVIKSLTQIASCPDVDKVPKCLSSVSANMRNKLPMSWVPPMQDRSIPPYLQDWIKGITKITEKEFFIMRREVKISEFQDYVDTLSPEDKQKLENFWRQDDFGEELPIENPVASVPWWAAKGYADWLSKKTNCPLTLPTYHQWVAASISYANPEVAVIRDRQQFFGLQPRQRIDKNQPSDDKSETSDNLFESLLFEEESTETSNDAVWDLLGNLREWSIDNKCPDKNYHYILGEDYNTWLKNISGKPICETGMSDMIGFRLVLSLKKSIKR